MIEIQRLGIPISDTDIMECDKCECEILFHAVILTDIHGNEFTNPLCDYCADIVQDSMMSGAMSVHAGML